MCDTDFDYGNTTLDLKILNRYYITKYILSSIALVNQFANCEESCGMTILNVDHKRYYLSLDTEVYKITYTHKNSHFLPNGSFTVEN